MKRIIFTTVLSFALAASIMAQNKIWSLDDCMRYAVENSPKVKQQLYTNNTYKAEHQSAIASFLPSISTQVDAQYRFGRSVDPETNTYVNTSTFNNGYGVYASLPLFRGGQLINQWRLANVNRYMGRNDLQKQKDDLAISIMDAFITVVYYQGLVKMCSEKLEDSQRLLYKTRRQEELGLKGKADVAQIESQVAGDDYNLTHQQNLYNTAMMTLKNAMNYPSDLALDVDTVVPPVQDMLTEESVSAIQDYAMANNPTALQAAFQLKASKMNYLITKGKLLPTLSVEAGISTSYFENLKSENAPVAFKNQFKNNRGEYIYFSFSFPFFDGLSRITNMRRARNNVRIAYEKQTETLRQLQKDVEQAVLDREGYAKETIQMEKKVKADALAYQITLRKFEEGLMSPLDVQTNATILLNSKADLLQRRLLYTMKCRQVDYYKAIFAQTGMSQEEEEELRELISQKNYFGVEELVKNKNMDKSLARVLSQLPQMFGSTEVLEKAKSLTDNPQALKAVARLEEIYELLKVYGYEKYVTFDFAMLSKYHYYTGIIFQAYTYGTGEALIKGGRYNQLMKHFGKPAASIGFAIVVDNLLMALSRQKIEMEEEEGVTVITYRKENRIQAIQKAKELRAQGRNVALRPEKVTKVCEVDL